MLPGIFPFVAGPPQRPTLAVILRMPAADHNCYRCRNRHNRPPLPPNAMSQSLSAPILLGLRNAAGLPSAMVFGGMLGFGALAHDSGFGIGPAVLSSVLIWGLPGQIAMAELHAVGTDALVIALAVSLANVRFLPLVVSLLPTLRGAAPGLALRLLIAQLLSATSWAYTMRAGAPTEPRARLAYYLAFALFALAVGAAGTALGHLATGAMPRPVALGLVFLNVNFLMLVLLDARARRYLLAVGFGAALVVPLSLLAPDIGLLITGLLGGSLAFWLDRRGRRRKARS